MCYIYFLGTFCPALPSGLVSLQCRIVCLFTFPLGTAKTGLTSKLISPWRNILLLFFPPYYSAFFIPCTTLLTLFHTSWKYFFSAFVVDIGYLCFISGVQVSEMTRYHAHKLHIWPQSCYTIYYIYFVSTVWTSAVSVTLHLVLPGKHFI